MSEQAPTRYCTNCRHYLFDFAWKMPDRCLRFRTPIGHCLAAERAREPGGPCGLDGEAYEPVAPAGDAARPWWRFW